MASGITASTNEIYSQVRDDSVQLHGPGVKLCGPAVGTETPENRGPRFSQPSFFLSIAMALPPLPGQSSAPHGLSTWLGRLQQSVMSLQAVAWASLGATGMVLVVRSLGLLQGMELALYDQLLRLRPDEGIDHRILVVGITEIDIQSRQEWPLSDRTLAELLTRLDLYQPRAIGLDLFRDVPLNPGHEALVSSIAQSDRLWAVCKMSSADNPGIAPPPGLSPEKIGFADVVVDRGGILRRSLLLASPPEFEGQRPQVHPCNTPGTALLSLGFQVAMAYLIAENVPIAQTEADEIQLGDQVLTRLQPSAGGYHGIEAQGYQILLNYRSAQTPVRVVSLTDVLSGQVDPAWIRDRIVLVGYTTPQAKDDFYTPYSEGLQDDQKMPGVLVHAQIASQLLSAVLDQRPLLWFWSGGIEAGWIFLGSLAGSLFAWYVRRPAWFVIGMVGAMGGFYGLAYGGLLLGGWIPLAPPLLSLVMAAGGVLLLDRFNRSDYGQAMYHQVKTLLRLEVVIDEHKVEQQVAEITESDYFSDLQLQAKMLRQKRRSAVPPKPMSSPITPPVSGPPPDAPQATSALGPNAPNLGPPPPEAGADPKAGTDSDQDETAPNG